MLAHILLTHVLILNSSIYWLCDKPLFVFFPARENVGNEWNINTVRIYLFGFLHWIFSCIHIGFHCTPWVLCEREREHLPFHFYQSYCSILYQFILLLRCFMCRIRQRVYNKPFPLLASVLSVRLCNKHPSIVRNCPSQVLLTTNPPPTTTVTSRTCSLSFCKSSFNLDGSRFLLARNGLTKHLSPVVGTITSNLYK